MLTIRHSSQQTQHWLAVIFLVACGLIPLPGCRQNQTAAPDSGVALPKLPAKEYLQSVFLRYRNAASYQDQATVKLRFKTSSGTVTESAPLSVALNGNQLFVQAYEIRLWVNGRDFTAWFEDPATENYDSQLLKANVSGERPLLNELLFDAVVQERVTGGLAGPPPQLDWLLSAKPMQRMFSGNVSIDYAPSVAIKDRDYHVIQVIADGDEYRFFIDSKTSLIHQVTLPVTAAMQNAEASLTLELTGASFAPISPSDLANVPKSARPVGHLIPIPPLQPPNSLGSTANEFSVSDRSGRVRFSNRGLGQDATIVLFPNRHRHPLAFTIGFDRWFTSVPQQLRSRIAAVVVTDQKTAMQIPSGLSLPVIIESGDQISRAFSRDTGWNSVIMDSKGTIAWMHQVDALSELNTLGPILGDVINGVDVPQRVRKQWLADLQIYRKSLEQEMARFQKTTQ